MIKQIHISECDSTQDILKEQLKLELAGQNLLVSCESQIQGRGRGDHQWESMPGSLCFSLTIEPHPVASFTAIELSVLVARFFEGSILSLKWPNDLWNKNQKKCCGILVQNFHGRMVAGIGINLFSDHPDYGGVFDAEFEFRKKSWSFEIANYIQTHRYQNTHDLTLDWEARCSHSGSLVIISENNEEVEGIFEGLGVHGEALIKTPNGLRRMYNGSLRVFSSGH